MCARERFISEAYLDFKLSRQALNCSPATLDFYRFTIGKFVEWLERQGIETPNSRDVRAYLAELAARNLKQNTINCHGRAIRTFFKFCLGEGYLADPVRFNFPRPKVTVTSILGVDHIKSLLKACRISRDRAIILLMLDTGLRRAETVALLWRDIDFDTGLVRVESGKGRKPRSVVIGIQTRRALLKYRRSIPHGEDDPVWLSNRGKRLTGAGLRMVFRRLGQRAGLKVTPHMLRRTFATLSLRSGVNPIHLQALMGHSTLEMTKRYVRIVEDDLISTHEKYGIVDRL